HPFATRRTPFCDCGMADRRLFRECSHVEGPMRTVRIGMLCSMVLAAAGCGGAGDSSDVPEVPSPDAAATPPADCSPLETRPPNAADQSPASPDQTRACAVTSDPQYEVVVVATGLVHPWA